MSIREKQALLGKGELMSIAQAARLTPYSAEYLSWCARNNKLAARKIARNWLTTSSAVTSFVNRQKQHHQTMVLKLAAAGKGRS